MAETRRKIALVAATAFQETLRRRVLWLVVILIGIIGLVMAENMWMMHMASDSGETGTANAIRVDLITSAFGIWTVAANLLAVFLGALALASESTGRTIVSVLSRPIDRTTYLTGRWLGVLSFLWAFQLVGIVVFLLLKGYLGASAAPTLWFGLAQTLAAVTLLSGVSLALSVVLPPVVAGVGAFLLPILPFMVSGALPSPRWIVRLPALAVYYLSPAGLEEDLVRSSFSGEALDPQYGLFARVIAENFVYAVVVFAVGCAIFARRELRVR